VEVIKDKIKDSEVVYMAPQAPLPLDQLGTLQLILIYDKSGNGLAATSEFLHRKHPRAAICSIVDTVEESTEALRPLIENHVLKGVIPANLRFDVFMSVIDLLLKGGEHFPAALVNSLKVDADRTVQTLAKDKPHDFEGQGNASLTARELEILDMICEGIQNKNIAYKLKLSENTVKVHVRNIYKKMRVRNRTEAAYLYFKQQGEESSASSQDGPTAKASAL
jgi:DNA-binding NarL/FixJ family response regulator